jgi:hypothetical protein
MIRSRDFEAHAARLRDDPDDGYCAAQAARYSHPRRILPRLLCAAWWLVAAFLLFASLFTLRGF